MDFRRNYPAPGSIAGLGIPWQFTRWNREMQHWSSGQTVWVLLILKLKETLRLFNT